MGGRVLAGKFTLACVVALCTSEASALTLMLYDAIPPLEQDIEACRTGQDRRLNKLTKDQRDEICIRAINEMERLKELGTCRDPEGPSWSICSAMPPEWAQGIWRNADETAIVEILPVGFLYRWKIAEMIFTGAPCAFIEAVDGVHEYRAECSGGVMGTMAFQSETEMSFDLNNYRKVSE